MINNKKSSKKFDVIIIGAGPGGLFAAYKLVKSSKRAIDVLIIDKGKVPSKRICPAIDKICENCKVCNLVSGGGGAGLFSDGKLILDLSVGGIRKFLGLYASMQMVGKEKYIEEIVHDVRLGVVDYESLEIGHVWKANLILETVKSINVEKYQEEVLKNLV